MHFIDHGQVSHKDRIVVVIGPTGAGKSNFIELATGGKGQTVGHGLKPYTTDIRAVKFAHANGPIVFVDTPGFDEPDKPIMDILIILVDWLEMTYKGDVDLARVIYLHRVSDNRMPGSLRNNLNTLKELCNQKAMPDIIVATTMWDTLSSDAVVKREEELSSDYWKDLLQGGWEVGRFENTRESAWHIIGSLPEKVWAQASPCIDQLEVPFTRKIRSLFERSV